MTKPKVPYISKEAEAAKKLQEQFADTDPDPGRETIDVPLIVPLVDHKLSEAQATACAFLLSNWLEASGWIVEITRKPKEPLAMRHHQAQVTIWRKQ